MKTRATSRTLFENRVILKNDMLSSLKERISVVRLPVMSSQAHVCVDLTLSPSLKTHMSKEMQTVTDHRIFRNTRLSTGSCAAWKNTQTTRKQYVEWVTDRACHSGLWVLETLTVMFLKGNFLWRLLSSSLFWLVVFWERVSLCSPGLSWTSLNRPGCHLGL